MAQRALVIDRDRGLRKLLRNVREARGATVKVGVTESVAPTPKEERQRLAKGQYGPVQQKSSESVTILDVAWWNEFGTMRKGKDGTRVPHVPARSFIRSTTDEEVSAIRRMKRALADKIMDGTTSVRAALGYLGEWFQAKIQRKITKLREPANAPSTIARKGSSNPLIDIGQLRSSIRYQVDVPREGLGS